MMVKDILHSVSLLAKPDRIAFAERMFPTKLRVVGATNPDLRLVLREIKGELKGRPAREVVDLAQELIKAEVLEAHWLGYELLGSSKNYLTVLTGADVDAMNRSLDTWVLTDVFATKVLGYAWRTGVLSDDWFTGHQSSDDHWQRRLVLASVVALNLPASGGVGDADRTIYFCQNAVSDNHPMVYKALSWALRSLIRWDRQSVENFLEAHEQELNRLVIREVRKKLETGKK